jgi:hypothetical protein
MKILPTLIFLSLLVACKPDSIDSTKMVYTGRINDDLILVVPNPIISILPYQPDDADSLDLNGDNMFELKFEKKSIPLTTAFGSITRIVTNNNLQIALSIINNHPDSLSVNTLLNSNSNWSDSESAIYELQSYRCNQFGCESVGNFINAKDKFIGYKLGSKFGWIEIDNSNNGELKIKEYSLIK